MADNPHGTFIWNELNTHNPDAAKSFLSATLGWSFEPMQIPDGTYWIIKNGETRAGGIFDMSGDARFRNVPEHWLSYVAVDDIDARYRKALAAGAKEARAPFDVPDVGRIGILAQPGGAMVAWMTPKPKQGAAR
jgi:predicted enzyme related to lactoylglutathione lyase